MVRTLAGGALALGASGLLSGCGALGGGTDQVCTDTKAAFQQYITQVRSIPAAEPGQWSQATEQLAGRLDGLAKETGDDDLKKALKTEATRLHAAAPAVGTGDVAQLNTVMKETPTAIGKACSS
jgi:hypothetical protein